MRCYFGWARVYCGWCEYGDSLLDTILYTIQLTAWTDAYGFDSRVSAKTQTTQTMRYNHRVKKMVKIKSLMFRIWLCDYTIERIDNALRDG